MSWSRESADSLLREAFAGFSALGVLSADKAAPFSEPTGTTLGEGAAFVVLERASDAARRGATSWASISGYGLSADAHHETTPHPAGDGVARAIRAALRDAGWSGGDVDFVSAHATGTANNDAIEWSVIQRELGSPGRAPAVSGSKGHVGHTQGASGALELVLALLCHREGRVPPTLHFRGARAGCPADPIAQAEPREMPVSRALKLSAAFGGANAVVAYACGDAPAPRERVRCPVVLTGAGVVRPSAARLASEASSTCRQNETSGRAAKSISTASASTADGSTARRAGSPRPRRSPSPTMASAPSWTELVYSSPRRGCRRRALGAARNRSGIEASPGRRPRRSRE